MAGYTESAGIFYVTLEIKSQCIYYLPVEGWQ